MPKPRHYDLSGGVRLIDGKWTVVVWAKNFQTEEEARSFSDLLCEHVTHEDFLTKVHELFKDHPTH